MRQNIGAYLMVSTYFNVVITVDDFPRRVHVAVLPQTDFTERKVLIFTLWVAHASGNCLLCRRKPRLLGLIYRLDLEYILNTRYL